MTAINRIREFVDSRGMTVDQFWKAAEAAGGLTEPTAYRLYKDPFSIPSGKVLDAIHEAFPEVTPNDFLAFVSEKEAEKIRRQKKRRTKKSKRSPLISNRPEPTPAASA